MVDVFRKQAPSSNKPDLCHSTHQAMLSDAWGQPDPQQSYTGQLLQQCSLGRMNRVTPETWSLLTSPSSACPQTDACKGLDLRCSAYFDYSSKMKTHYFFTCCQECSLILIYGLFNSAVSSSHNTVSNCTMICEKLGKFGSDHSLIWGTMLTFVWGGDWEKPRKTCHESRSITNEVHTFKTCF
jgi:hypothetical protein